MLFELTWHKTKLAPQRSCSQSTFTFTDLNMQGPNVPLSTAQLRYLVLSMPLAFTRQLLEEVNS